MIEKNIFQTFINQNLPDEILEIRNLLISKNPKYSYHFFSDEDILDFIKTYYDNEVFSAYCKINIGAAKADFWRYLVLNYYGGVYLDIDSLIEIPLDCFINVEDKAILTREKNPNHFVQWCLMIKKDHPILRKVIYKVIKKINERKESRLNYITGPPVFSEAIEELYNDLGFHSIYYTDDSKINALMDVNSDRYARFIGTDYDNPSFIFKHRHAKLIYMRKVHWREEQKEKPVVKKLNFFKRIARGLTS
jgi:mannosyltransferase OCH1-like enzyme